MFIFKSKGDWRIIKGQNNQSNTSRNRTNTHKSSIPNIIPESVIPVFCTFVLLLSGCMNLNTEDPTAQNLGTDLIEIKTIVQRHDSNINLESDNSKVKLSSPSPTIPTVVTNKEDYGPGETAHIYADGFEPGETVEFLVLHIGGKSNEGNGHTPWLVTDGGIGDLDGSINGKIETTWYVDPDDSLNSLFELSARGKASNLQATTTFTDDVGTPTSVSSSYDVVTKTLTVTVNWIWTDEPKKVMTAAVFADLNGDNISPSPTDDPTTYDSGGNLSVAAASEEFLGQIASSSIEGFTTTGDSTDSGISSIALDSANLSPNTPIVLWPYLANPSTPATTGSFVLTYINVPNAPSKICVVLYDIHVNKKNDDTMWLGNKYVVIEGEVDFDNDGSIETNGDDDTIDLEGTTYDLIDGQVDVNSNGSIEATDDITDNTFFGFDVIDGFVDVKIDGSISNKDDGCFSSIVGIDDMRVSPTSQGNHIVITSGPDVNTDNSTSNGFPDDVTCDDPEASTTPTVVCPPENTGPIEVMKN